MVYFLSSVHLSLHGGDADGMVIISFFGGGGGGGGEGIPGTLVASHRNGETEWRY
jgi:hypothetical protein